MAEKIGLILLSIPLFGVFSLFFAVVVGLPFNFVFGFLFGTSASLELFAAVLSYGAGGAATVAFLWRFWPKPVEPRQPLRFTIQDLLLAVALIALGMAGLCATDGLLWCMRFSQSAWSEDAGYNIFWVCRTLLSFAAIGAGVGTPFRAKRLCAFIAMIPFAIWTLFVLKFVLGDGR